MMDDDNFDVEDNKPQGQYLQIDRNKNFPPLYIWQDLIGVSAQRRRAYLLQSKYLTPLTFEYVVLMFFFRYVLISFLCSLLLVLWLVVGSSNRVIYLLLLVSLISIYIGYQWSVSKNTSTVKEEVLYNILINVLASLFAVFTVFDLRSFFTWLFSSPF